MKRQDYQILLLIDPPPTGLYFTLNGTVYFPNEIVYIEDIGPAMIDRNDRGAALVCHTDNVNTACCRGSDSNGKGPIGDWFYPNNSQVIHNNQDTTTTNIFFRIVFEKELRLVARGSPAGPLGLYTCSIPTLDRDLINASIYIMSGE